MSPFYPSVHVVQWWLSELRCFRPGSLERTGSSDWWLEKAYPMKGHQDSWITIHDWLVNPSWWKMLVNHFSSDFSHRSTTASQQTYQVLVNEPTQSHSGKEELFKPPTKWWLLGLSSFVTPAGISKTASTNANCLTNIIQQTFSITTGRLKQQGGWLALNMLVDVCSTSVHAPCDRSRSIRDIQGRTGHAVHREPSNPTRLLTSGLIATNKPQPVHLSGGPGRTSLNQQLAAHSVQWLNH